MTFHRRKSKLVLQIICILSFALVSINGWSQNYTIKGTIYESESRESLPIVPIAIKQLPQKSVHTNEDGKYSITLPKGDYTLIINYLGCTEAVIDISLTKNVTKNVYLKRSDYDLGEVVVTGQQPDANVSAPQTGVQRLEIELMNKLPVLLGERDIIKTIQLTPGIKSAGEGSSGFFVRGGTADQNLMLLDNVSLYNASHLMGFFSTFNSDVISDVTLYKGTMPSQHGERLASILEVQQRNGDNKDYHLSGGIGLISSKINVEGPIQKNKSSFLIGGRRTYADAVARLAGIKEVKNSYLYFYDMNAKADFALSKKDHLSFSGYWGKDRMVLKDAASLDWGNLLGSLRWNRMINNKWNSKTTVFYNQYDYHMEQEMGMDLKGKSKIADYGLKQEFLFTPKEGNIWRFGFQSTLHDLAPGDYDLNSSDQDNAVNLHHRYASENALYASNQLQITDNLEVVYGLRLSGFAALGKGEYYTLDQDKNVLDSTWYKSGKVVKKYFNLEPRVSAAYKLNPESSIKAAYARTTQNMHLLSYSAQGTPFDRWAMSSNNIKPQIADQVSLGYFRNFNNNTYEFSVEAYYKNMRNQIDFKDNADFNGYDVVESELLYGKGRAYGIEFMFKKRIGRFTGWISYTLSKSEKQINGINNDKWYNAFQDRTHDISLVGMYTINPKWSLSAAWVYYTGNALTYPSGKYQINGKDVMYYAERNGYRAPAYHRLDIGATRQLKKTSKFESELVFGLYNAYGRENAYMIQFRTNDKDPGKTTAYQYSLFTFVPSISWNFKY